MEYVTIKDDQKIEFFRRQLLQAEADHLVHSFEELEADEAVKGLPPKPGTGTDPHADARRNATGRKAERAALTKAAESRAARFKAELDKLGAPYVEPEPEPAPEPTE